MTQDEIIRMAREAGFYIENWSFGERVSVYESGKTIDITNELKDFAALVAANEREKCFDAAMKAAEKAVDAAMLLEREACAKVCDDEYARFEHPWNGANKCAAAIRSRSNEH